MSIFITSTYCNTSRLFGEYFVVVHPIGQCFLTGGSQTTLYFVALCFDQLSGEEEDAKFWSLSFSRNGDLKSLHTQGP
jgi:hypothetical protein